MKFLHIAILIVISLLVACTRPYDPPVAEHPIDRVGDPKDKIVFDGALQTLASSESDKLRMIFTHGMCSHKHGSEWPRERLNMLEKVSYTLLGFKQQDMEWAERRSDALAEALGVNSKKVKKGKEYRDEDGKILVYTQVFTYNVGEREIEAHFLIWGPAVDRFRAKLEYENYRNGEPAEIDGKPANTEEYDSPKRAYVNNKFRREFNRCLMDAVVYLGQSGDTTIHKGMQRAVCEASDGDIEMDAEREALLCISNKEEPIVVVAESLGSAILTDTVVTLIKGGSFCVLNDAGRSGIWYSPVKERFLDVSSIFLDTNQIPFLRQAQVDESNSLNKFLDMASKAIKSREECEKEHSMKTIQVVAISDPNDFLSHRLKYEHFNSDEFELYNVLVSNANTYLGLIENPLKAHFSSERAGVFSIIVEGSDALNR